MITTKDVKTKDAKPEKLTILTTGKHKPEEFTTKGKPKPRDKRMITTSNVEEFQKELEKKKASKPNGPHSPKKITVMDKEK